jgi:putative DNA N-6-adenine-methyltransferase of bacteriophage
MKQLNPVLFSSIRMDWATPQTFFDALDAEFQFTLDPCASVENAKCKKFYTVAENGLAQDWSGETVFCNPPYGRAIYDWVFKCWRESRKPCTTVVMLIPSRTDTRYFHEFIYKKAREIRFIRGRLRFGNGTNPAPFPSMVIVF